MSDRCDWLFATPASLAITVAMSFSVPKKKAPLSQRTINPRPRKSTKMGNPVFGMMGAESTFTRLSNEGQGGKALRILDLDGLDDLSHRIAMFLKGLQRLLTEEKKKLVAALADVLHEVHAVFHIAVQSHRILEGGSES